MFPPPGCPEPPPICQICLLVFFFVPPSFGFPNRPPETPINQVRGNRERPFSQSLREFLSPRAPRFARSAAFPILAPEIAPAPLDRVITPSFWLFPLVAPKFEVRPAGPPPAPLRVFLPLTTEQVHPAKSHLRW